MFKVRLGNNIPRIPKAHVRLRVRPHVSRRKLAKYDARISTNMNVFLSLLGQISQHMSVLVQSSRFLGIFVRVKCPFGIFWAYLLYLFSPIISTSNYYCCGTSVVPDVCLPGRHWVARRKSAGYSARTISTSIRHLYSPGNVSQHSTSEIIMQSIVRVLLRIFVQV